jgi:mannose/fructose/N-acetylgalactosamine-specific phosphotransferase system component IIB
MKRTRKKEKLDNIIQIGEHEIERVQEFKYLGTQVNAQNIMNEEINSRIKQGNIVFYANKSLLGNKLLTRKAKIKLYQSSYLW